MHIQIIMLVPGEDRDDAMSTAQGALHQLVEWGIFDCTKTHDDPDMEDLPDATRADTPEGKALIAEALAKTREEFMQNVEAVRATLATFTNEELFEENPCGKSDPEHNCHMFRCTCCEIGMQEGSRIHLYDEDAGGIQTSADLQSVLMQGATWAVPAIVHR